MKRIIKYFMFLLVFLTLSGCGFFGGSELTIADITTETKDGKLYLVITYTDEFTEPSYFELAQGEDGARGNGIADIITDDKTKPGYTLVTVKYTDTSLRDENFELPHGVSIADVVVRPATDEEGNPLVDEEGNPTGEEELYITFTSGKKPIKIPYSKPKDGKDGREIEMRSNETHIQWRYTGEDDESWKDLISLDLIKGKDGQIIQSLSIIEENGEFLFAVYYEGSILPETYPITELQQPAQWHTGNGYPPSNLGKVGDFYLDKTQAKIYQKQGENQWGDAIVDFGSPESNCTIKFIATKGTIVGQSEFSDIKYGTYFYGTGKNIPTVDAPDGFEFIGWSTKENPTATDGYFTNLTPVFGYMELYAVFEEVNK